MVNSFDTLGHARMSGFPVSNRVGIVVFNGGLASLQGHAKVFPRLDIVGP